MWFNRNQETSGKNSGDPNEDAKEKKKKIYMENETFGELMN